MSAIETSSSSQEQAVECGAQEAREPTPEQLENFTTAFNLVSGVVDRVRKNNPQFEQLVYTEQPQNWEDAKTLSRSMHWNKIGEAFSGNARVCTKLSKTDDTVFSVEVQSHLFDHRGDVPKERITPPYVNDSWGLSDLSGADGFEDLDAFRKDIKEGVETAIFDVLDVDVLADSDAEHFKPILPNAA
jgi:hypothetical protein